MLPLSPRLLAGLEGFFCFRERSLCIPLSSPRESLLGTRHSFLLLLLLCLPLPQDDSTADWFASLDQALGFNTRILQRVSELEREGGREREREREIERTKKEASITGDHS